MCAGTVAVLAGCSSGPNIASPPSPTPVSTAVIAQLAVTVAVTSQGAQPLRQLALSPAADSGQVVMLSTTSSITQTVGSNPEQNLSTPQLRLPLTATAPGAGTVGLTLGEATSPDPVLTAALAKANGSGAQLLVQRSGAVQELRITPAAGVSDSARAAVEQALRQAVQFAPVLPDAPVGVGAVWTVTAVIDSLGLQISQVTTLTLTAVHANTLTLGVQLTQTPQTSTWTLPGQGGTLNVDAYPVAGSGTLTVDLTKPLPVGGAVELGGNQVYSDPASALQLKQTVTSTVAWQS